MVGVTTCQEGGTGLFGTEVSAKNFAGSERVIGVIVIGKKTAVGNMEKKNTRC